VPQRLPPAWVVRPLLAFRNGIGRLHDAIAPPQLPLFERFFGLADAKCIAVVAELGVADQLDKERSDAVALATKCGADPDALARVLRYLVGRGVFARDRHGRFRNNRLSELLRSGTPDSQRDWARMWGASWHIDIWNHLDHSVRTGKSAATEAFGRPFWEQLGDVNPAAGALFDGAMADVSRLQTELVPRQHDFSACRTVCDIGGGTGTLLSGVLAANPNVHGVLFDMPTVVAKAGPVLERAGVADRVRVVGGDFFTSVPDGCDRYLLQAIVHDWDDESCVKILANVRAAMAPNARVLVFEQELPRHDGAHPAKLIDLEMLVDTGAGRERTRDEFTALFARAGLRIAKTRALPVVTIFELIAG
jgi:O-methyltransferase domain